MVAALLLAAFAIGPPVPAVRVLRDKPAYRDCEQSSEFFRTLARLLPADPDPQVGGRLTYRSASGMSWLSSGRALPVGPPADGLTAVVLGANSNSVPGTAAELLVLLDPAGKELDRVAVGINSRYGGLLTETSRTDPGDGARLVVRFVPGGLFR